MADLNSQIQSGIQQSQMQAALGVSPVPYHTHDGVNSPRLAVSDSSSVFSGAVNSDGTAGAFMPTGWTTSHLGSGRYAITTGKSSANCVCAATPVSQFAYYNVTYSATSPQIIFWFVQWGPYGERGVDTSFNFIAIYP